jgi:hypothetical protein
MSTFINQPARSATVYPDSDGQPMSDKTLQFKRIVLIKEGLETQGRRILIWGIERRDPCSDR